MSNLSLFKELNPGKKAQDIFHGDEAAIIFTRVSTQKQAEYNHSLETQQKRCEEYCKKNNLLILASFGEKHESAKNSDGKEFNRMLKFVKDINSNNKSGYKITKIVVMTSDRFSRSGPEVFAIVAELKKLGCYLISCDNQIDATTPYGQLSQEMGLVYNKFENTLRREKSVIGTQQMLLAGAWPTKAPLGYDKVPDNSNRYKKCVISPKGKLIKRAFTMKINGISNTEIQKWLATQGLKMHRQKLTDILKIPFIVEF